MALTERVRITFVGRFATPSFLEFVNRRAARLDLDVAVLSTSSDRIAVDIRGQPDLIDAFEMACSLGPLNCMVIDCERSTLQTGKTENRDR